MIAVQFASLSHAASQADSVTGTLMDCRTGPLCSQLVQCSGADHCPLGGEGGGFGDGAGAGGDDHPSMRAVRAAQSKVTFACSNCRCHTEEEGLEEEEGAEE